MLAWNGCDRLLPILTRRVRRGKCTKFGLKVRRQPRIALASAGRGTRESTILWTGCRLSPPGVTQSCWLCSAVVPWRVSGVILVRGLLGSALRRSDSGKTGYTATDSSIVVLVNGLENVRPLRVIVQPD